MPTKNASISPEWTDPDDATELTEAMLKDAEYFHGNTFVRRGPGRPNSKSAKEQISMRLDPTCSRSCGRRASGWQSQINGLLRQALGLGKSAANRAT